MQFSLKIALTSTSGELVETNLYRYVLGFELLKEVGRDEVCYDPKLKIHFKSNTSLSYIYQLDIQHVDLSLCPRLEKASDLIRRASYINDWAEVNVKPTGQVISIENIGELKSTWTKLKSRIVHDYKGVAVDKYMEEIDERLNVDLPFLDIVTCYHILGLILPGIPEKHESDWRNERIVSLSEYETEQFEEQTVYNKIQDGVRVYSITGKTVNSSKLRGVKFSGIVAVPKDEILPIHSEVEVSYTNDNVLNEWKFTLDRY